MDNQSTVNVFYNALFLRNIQKVDKELYLYTNAGMSAIDEGGVYQNLELYGLTRMEEQISYLFMQSNPRDFK